MKNIPITAPAAAPLPLDSARAIFGISDRAMYDAYFIVFILLTIPTLPDKNKQLLHTNHKWYIISNL